MTLEEIRASGAEFLTPAQVAGVLGCAPYAINVQAKADASKLGFPVCITGRRVRIPRRRFLRFMGCDDEPTKEASA